MCRPTARVYAGHFVSGKAETGPKLISDRTLWRTRAIRMQCTSIRRAAGACSRQFPIAACACARHSLAGAPCADKELLRVRAAGIRCA